MERKQWLQPLEKLQQPPQCEVDDLSFSESLTDFSSAEEQKGDWLEKQLRCETVVDLSGLSTKAKRAIGEYNDQLIRCLGSQDLYHFLQSCKAYIRRSKEEITEAKIQSHEDYMAWRDLKYPEFRGQDYYLHKLRKEQGDNFTPPISKQLTTFCHFYYG